MELEGLRRQIDDIDEEIIGLLAKRSELVKKVAGLKGECSLIWDPQREEQILSRLKKIGEKAGVSSRLIETLYSALFEDSKAQQRALLGRQQ